MNNPVQVISPVSQTLLNDVDYYKSPDHYIVDDHNAYIRLDCTVRVVSYIAHRIALWFCQLGRYLIFRGWENDTTLWNRLNVRLSEIHNNQEAISDIEFNELNRAYKELKARLDRVFQNHVLPRIDNAVAIIEGLKRKVIDKNDKITNLNRKMVGLNIKKARREKEIDRLKQDFSQLENQHGTAIDGWKRKVIDKDDKIIKLNRSVVDLNIQKMGKKNEINGLNKNISQLTTQYENTIKKLNEDLDTLRRENELQQYLLDQQNVFNSTRTEENEMTSKLGHIVEDNISMIEEHILNQKSHLESTLGSDDIARHNLKLEEKHCNFHSYFADPDAFSKLKETDLIGFNEGKMVFLEKPDPIEIKKFKQLLIETFGKYLTYKIWARYNFDKLEILTLGDVKKAFVAAGTNVRVLDLRCLHAEIRRHDKYMLALRCGESLSRIDPKMFDSIKKEKVFENLSSDQIHFLVSAFRNIPNKDFTAFKPTLDILYTDVAKVKKDNEVNYRYYHDLQFLEVLSQWNKLEYPKVEDGDIKVSEQDHYRLALSEYTGKTLAYYDLEKDMLIALPNKKGNPVYFTVRDCENQNGVIPSLLVPLKYHSINNNEIHLVFRGTAEARQWLRNIDWRGVGKNEFEKNVKYILRMLRGYVEEKNINYMSLHIAGHSLGGADTQRALVAILEAIAASDLGDDLMKIKKLIVTTHNSPRPESELNTRLKKALYAAKEKKIKIGIDMTHVRYFDKEREDVVQNCGDVLIGCDKGVSEKEDIKLKDIFKSCINFQRNLVNIQIEESYGASGVLGRHTFRPFNKALRTAKWKFTEILSGDIEEHRKKMEAIFASNHFWDHENAGLKQSFYWMFTKYASMPLKSLHFVTNYMMHPVLNK